MLFCLSFADNGRLFFLGNTFEQKKDTLLATGGFPEAFTRVSSSQNELVAPSGSAKAGVVCRKDRYFLPSRSTRKDDHNVFRAVNRPIVDYMYHYIYSSSHASLQRDEIPTSGRKVDYWFL